MLKIIALCANGMGTSSLIERSNAFVGDIEAADLGDTKVIGVKNLMSDKEIEKKMKEYMDDKGIKYNK